MFRLLTLVGMTVLLFLPATAWTAELTAPMAVYDGGQLAQKAEEPPPLRIAENQGLAPIASLPRASVAALDQLNAVAAWNKAGKLPVRNGITRPLASTQWIDLRARGTAVGPHAGGILGQSGISSSTWGASVEVEGAQRLRLGLTEVNLPNAAKIWVYGQTGGFVGPFGAELITDGSLWTPSVEGSVIYLEVELPVTSLGADTQVGFQISQVVELFALNEDGSPASVFAPKVQDPSCLIDATCIPSSQFPGVEAVRQGIGHLEFISPAGPAICTGALINDLDTSTTIPYLLTANHCFSTGAAANSLQVFWRWFTNSCFGSAPSLSSVPRSVGSTLVATNPASDFTLVRLGNDVPAGSALLGWDARSQAVAPGTILHRLSHPAPGGFPFPQSYSRSRALGVGEVCFSDTLSVIGEKLEGGTFGGSSGAPILLSSGAVVGQLQGQCGASPDQVENGCDFSNVESDGWFGRTFNDIAGILQGGEGGDGQPPPPSGSWLSSPALPAFEAQVLINGTRLGESEGQCIPETLCVSGALAGRPEVFVKVIGPRPNGFLWSQLSRFTPSKLEIWLRQTSTGQINYYELAAVGASNDNVSGLQDREAFTP